MPGQTRDLVFLCLDQTVRDLNLETAVLDCILFSQKSCVPALIR